MSFLAQNFCDNNQIYGMSGEFHENVRLLGTEKQALRPNLNEVTQKAWKSLMDETTEGWSPK